MTNRPRVLVLGGGERAAVVRAWLLESGAIPVFAGDAAGVVVADAAASDADAVTAAARELPVLDAATASRSEVAAFARVLAGKSAHAFDDHGSREAWPRGSY